MQFIMVAQSQTFFTTLSILVTTIGCAILRIWEMSRGQRDQTTKQLKFSRYEPGNNIFSTIFSAEL